MLESSRVEGFPVWGIYFLIMGDPRGLAEEGKNFVISFAKEHEGKILRIVGDTYFSKSPLFGLPCMCTDISIMEVK